MDRRREIAMVREHIRVGGQHIARQREIIARYEVLGVNTALSQSVLDTLEETQAQHERHLMRILAG